jgi:hypothetical protein
MNEKDSRIVKTAVEAGARVSAGQCWSFSLSVRSR